MNRIAFVLLGLSLVGVAYGLAGGTVPPIVVVIGCTVVATMASIALLTEQMNQNQGKVN